MRTCCGQVGIEREVVGRAKEGRRQPGGRRKVVNGELLGVNMEKECRLRNGRPNSDQISARSERQRVVQPKGW